MSFSGFVANNQGLNTDLTASLANNLNFDYINSMNESERYIYRIKQSSETSGNMTVPQLVFSIWSGRFLKLIEIKTNR